MGGVVGRVASGIGSVLVLLCVYVPGAGAAPPPGNTVPGAPSIDSVIPGAGNAVVNVHLPDDDGGAPIMSYGASCTSSDFGAAGNATSPTTPVLVGVLTTNATYTCTATVTNNVGTSDPSLPSGVFVIPPGPASGAITGTVTTAPAATLSGYCAEATDISGGGNISSAAIAVDGSYTLLGLADHTYAVRFVDCSGGGDYFPRWYGGGLVTPGKDDPTQEGALPVVVMNGATMSGIDGVLSLGAHVTGTVTDTDDHPLEHVCAGAISNFDQQAFVITAADGTYDLLAPPGTFVVAFYDCWGSDIVTQFWDHVSLERDATQLTVVAGTTTPGIDAKLVHGGRVVGTVTDATTHDPIENACVSVWNDDANASNRTDGNGQYYLDSLPAGIYQASFVDCAEHPTHGGTTRTGVLVISGDKTTVDVELGEAATGSISGHLTTEFGTPLEGACVAVLSGLAGEPRFAGPTGPDGAYEVDGIGSGWYFVGFFGCNGDSPSALMPDPAHPGTTYHAQWYSNAWLGANPDPFGDGATPVEVASGKTTVVNECFDRCNDSIWINGGEAGNRTVRLDFLSTVPGASVGQGLAATAATGPPDAVPEYVATCTSPDGGVTGVSTSETSPAVVTGLTNGSSYACVVATTIGDVTYVSGASATLVPQGTDPTSPPSPIATDAEPTNTALAFTGAAHTTRLVIVGLAMVLVGAAAMLLARRRRPSVRC